MLSKDFYSEDYAATQPLPPLPLNPALAMAYVPFQQANELYEPEKGLSRGTLFPELDKPFAGRDALA